MKSYYPIKPQKARVALGSKEPQKLVVENQHMKMPAESSKGLVTRTWSKDSSFYNFNQVPRGPFKRIRMERK